LFFCFQKEEMSKIWKPITVRIDETYLFIVEDIVNIYTNEMLVFTIQTSEITVLQQLFCFTYFTFFLCISFLQNRYFIYREKL